MSLPPELDFQRDRDASPARMNRAMEYIAAALRQALALKPDYEIALAELRDVGLARLVAALQPVVERANALAAELAEVHDRWVADNAITIMKAEILAAFDLQFDAISDDLDSRIDLVSTDLGKVRAQLDAQAVDRWFFA
ncbi:MAG TPA: hypothetical protein VF649_06645 [Sphingomonas sp.]|jgi:hypothetical protein|uniref:hypothetical protein n=1 Tax=Sphingomonas sp. TaxID=28214 RepID=UPI002EDA5856